MRWLSAIGGVMVMAAGVGVTISVLATTPKPDEAAASLAAPLVPPAVVVAGPTTTTTTTAQIAPPSIAGLDPTVAEALSALGYTEFVGTSDLRAQLPESVVEALIDEGAVLVIADRKESP
jgi:hypothetical protein